MFTLIKENQVNAAIPDAGSYTDSIQINKSGSVRDIKINTNITHPYIGDISLTLSSPSGKEVVLRTREGGSADDLAASFEGDIVAELIGEQAKGLWTLTAMDHSTKDSGTLDSWSLEIDCLEYSNQTTEIYIPEVEASDILYSTQECRFAGRVTQSVVDVEIDHPLVGDLIVSIVSPNGTEVVLHDRTGGSQKHLKKSWSGDALKGLVGEKTAGTWTLKVKNMHDSNNGTLKSWKIKFHYEPEEDLTVVEGIGPKIGELLKNAGIYNYVSLATTSADTIKDILEAAGSRFSMHDPTTWPAQASLAAQGRWDELDTLKDELDGGRA